MVSYFDSTILTEVFVGIPRVDPNILKWVTATSLHISSSLLFVERTAFRAMLQVELLTAPLTFYFYYV
jgi:hypothetical protein